MNDKVNELVEWVAEYLAVKFSHRGFIYVDAADELKECWRKHAKQILSHPDLYLRDYDIEVAELDDLYEAFTPLAEEVKI